MNEQKSQLINKVPAVTAIFWIIKVLSTTVGETVADYTDSQLNLGLLGTSFLYGLILIVALTFQFRSKKYRPSLYWLVAVLMSITGTLITDFLGDKLGVSLITTSIIFAGLLIVIFTIWYRRERTLSIKYINTKSREAFYWLAILATFSLGTSTGDLIAEKLDVGYGRSWLLFVGVILLITLIWRIGVISSVLTFWLVYIMTRPLGAASGDFISQSKKDGGLGLGTGATSAIFLGAIVALVIYISRSTKDSSAALHA